MVIKFIVTTGKNLEGQTKSLPDNIANLLIEQQKAVFVSHDSNTKMVKNA